jgi:hypothetical protein
MFDIRIPMKFLILVFAPLACFLFSCKKDDFINSPDARLIAATDTVRFDTVFTTVGSITKYFTLVNDNNQKLMISSIKLNGGTGSPFKMNVNGMAGSQFSNIELNANDSIYVFVKVTVDPQLTNTPFLVLDSIEINYNGNTSKVYLQAFGQNARYISNKIIDVNTTWDNSLPYVIENNLIIAEDATLTIEKGTHIYSHATAAFIVNGTLKVMGEKEENDRVVFRGDRLDADYKDLPGGWPGIIFTGSSRNNEMIYTNVLNAYQSVVVAGDANLTPAKLTMNECIIHNAYDVGVYTINSSVDATNCLISQCGNNGLPGTGGSNVLITGGGVYNFSQCTIATYANLYQNHKQPACFITNADGGSIAYLNANFTNCIIYGQGGVTEDELIVNKANTDFVNFSNTIFKIKNPEPPGVIFNDCIKNADPLFDSINTSTQTYNFRLRDSSPGIDAGKSSAINIDLDGNTRPVGTKPDIGCYERQ